jgi:hypothetical protein
MAWSIYVRVLLGTFWGLVALAASLVAIANPYGNLWFSPLRHVIMDDNQRFQYPSVIRSGRYDSMVVGTSTARLLEPAELERRFGGRFANLALNSGTAWEQMRLTRLFAETIPRRGMLVLAIDHVWCDEEADVQRITRRGFPEWMFDADPWNDLVYMLNVRTVEIAGRRIGHALGLVRERWPHNGYEVFVPPESEYDLSRAREHIWGKGGVPRPLATSGEGLRAELASTPPQRFRFPALNWLDQLLEPGHGWQRIVILMPPTHVAGVPGPGHPGHARELACKAAISDIARRRGVPLVDFRIPSPITTQDSNYWDALHYRVPVATRIVSGLARALATGADDPAGDWVVRFMPSR